MSQMIPVSTINGNQFMKARMEAATLPVIVRDEVNFVIASSTRAECVHRVQFDSADSPLACSCSCEAGAKGRPCWAMARAFDVLTLLSINRIYISAVMPVGETPPASGAPDTGQPLSISIEEEGDLSRDAAMPTRDGETAVLAG